MTSKKQDQNEHPIDAKINAQRRWLETTRQSLQNAGHFDMANEISEILADEPKKEIVE